MGSLDCKSPAGELREWAYSRRDPWSNREDARVAAEAVATVLTAELGSNFRFGGSVEIVAPRLIEILET
jgi:hypothetical protein